MMNDAYIDEEMMYQTIIKFYIWSKEALVAFEKVLSKLNSHICRLQLILKYSCRVCQGSLHPSW